MRYYILIFVIFGIYTSAAFPELAPEISAFVATIVLAYTLYERGHNE